jgi:hypothetical protein
MQTHKPKFTCIVFFPPDDPKGRRPRKYRNIISLDNFTKFAAREGAHYVNAYDKASRQYVERRYC